MNVSQAARVGTLVAGRLLDRYELLCPVAEGGMAAVWLGRLQGKHGFQKLVAIKTILPRYTAEPGFREMFLDEARLAARIEHVNVAQILDLGEADVMYHVLEWVDGDSLFKLERAVAKLGRALPLPILLRILSDACLGLHAAHEVRGDSGELLGVVHRDVSPQNLLVSASGITKLIDFGIAKARERLTKATTAGIVKGKLMYMAPEQALGMPVNRRADIWSIGAVFYRLLKGKAPYEASNPQATMRLLQEGRLPEPLVPSSRLPAVVCDVIGSALRPSAKERFETALELHDALETAMAMSGMDAKTRDVAAYLATTVGERAVARKQAIQLALEQGRARASGQSRSTPIPSPSPPISVVALRPAEDVRTRRLDGDRGRRRPEEEPPREVDSGVHERAAADTTPGSAFDAERRIEPAPPEGRERDLLRASSRSKGPPRALLFVSLVVLGALILLGGSELARRAASARAPSVASSVPRSVAVKAPPPQPSAADGELAHHTATPIELVTPPTSASPPVPTKAEAPRRATTRPSATATPSPPPRQTVDSDGI